MVASYTATGLLIAYPLKEKKNSEEPTEGITTLCKSAYFLYWYTREKKYLKKMLILLEVSTRHDQFLTFKNISFV